MSTTTSLSTVVAWFCSKSGSLLLKKTDYARQLLRARSSLCELANAILKPPPGMAEVLVRSLDQVTCEAMLAAIGANILQHPTALLALPARR